MSKNGGEGRPRTVRLSNGSSTSSGIVSNSTFPLDDESASADSRVRLPMLSWTSRGLQATSSTKNVSAAKRKMNSSFSLGRTFDDLSTRAQQTFHSDDQTILHPHKLCRIFLRRNGRLKAGLEVVRRLLRSRGASLVARSPSDFGASDVKDWTRELLGEALDFFGVVGGELLVEKEEVISEFALERRVEVEKKEGRLTSKARTKSSRKAPFSPWRSLTKCWTAVSD